MVDKFKDLLQHPSYVVLKDTRVLGLIAFGIVALLVSWSGVKTIQTNYELQKQIASLEQQNMVKKLENDNQKLRNEYYKTDQFLELAARRQFGKAAPGEKLYIVPKKVALANSIDISKKDTAQEKAKIKSGVRKNLQDWFEFFIHKKD
jgi:cell division protein FtsB